MDLLAAMTNNDPSERGPNRCELGAFLDSIPNDQPGRDRFAYLVETTHNPRAGGDTVSARRAGIMLRRAGSPVSSEAPVLKHRDGDCACWR